MLHAAPYYRERRPVRLTDPSLPSSARALEEGDDSESDEEDEVASLDEDEDELDDESTQYLELLQKKVQEASPSSPFTISSQIIEVRRGSLSAQEMRAYGGYVKRDSLQWSTSVKLLG